MLQEIKEIQNYYHYPYYMVGSQEVRGMWLKKGVSFQKC